MTIHNNHPSLVEVGVAGEQLRNCCPAIRVRWVNQPERPEAYTYGVRFLEPPVALLQFGDCRVGCDRARIYALEDECLFLGLYKIDGSPYGEAC